MERTDNKCANISQAFIVSKIDHEKFVELWNKRTSSKIMAKELGISESYVYYYARFYRDECPKRGVKVNREKFIELWNSEYLVKDIAKELGVSESFVYRYASVHRDECPSRHYQGDYAKLVELWNAGVKVHEISELLGIAEYNIRAYAFNHQDECHVRRSRKKVGINYSKLIELWNKGVPSSEIAKLLGVSEKYVNYYAYLHRNLCPKRKKTWKSKEK